MFYTFVRQHGIVTNGINYKCNKYYITDLVLHIAVYTKYNYNTMGWMTLDEVTVA